ncbi:MAG: porphobilinogen synthase, partial [Desulfosalsimonas sp.]
MQFPDYRPRRLRQTGAFRRMVRETTLKSDDLIMPFFAIGGKDVKNPVPSMPGQYQMSVDNLVKTVKHAADMGILAVILFGLPDKKDPLGTRAYAKDGIVQKAVRAVKDKCPEMMVITDVCLCQYTDHGHCGIVDKGVIDNDASLDLLARTAVSHAEAGAD